MEELRDIVWQLQTHPTWTIVVSYPLAEPPDALLPEQEAYLAEHGVERGFARPNWAWSYRLKSEVREAARAETRLGEQTDRLIAIMKNRYT